MIDADLLFPLAEPAKEVMGGAGQGSEGGKEGRESYVSHAIADFFMDSQF